jgi:hypothetical protein
MPPPLPRMAAGAASATEAALAVLPVMRAFVRLSVAPASTKMPPPTPTGTAEPAGLATPPVMVSPDRFTSAPPRISKTREAWLPSIVRQSAPGPWIVTLAPTCSSPEVKVMAPWRPLSKAMTSPFRAWANSKRSEPSPESLRLVTVRVLGTARSSRRSSAGRKRGRATARGAGRRHSERAKRATR